MNTDFHLRRVFIIDDDPTFNRILQRAMSNRGIATAGAQNADGLAQTLHTFKPDAVILDLNLNGHSGLELIDTIRKAVPGARILVLTGYASITTAVEAIKRGAYQYLAKPTDVDSILRSLESPSDETADGELEAEPMSVGRLEWEHIQRVLAEHNGNISATARALKMHRRTLQRKLAKRPVKT